ncbi:MAG: hypothetical protein JW860_03135 [Sedimentisphaerales bacterium]|nr:hypothetical protein [Sedimentisphaerales bacterium]
MKILYDCVSIRVILFGWIFGLLLAFTAPGANAGVITFDDITDMNVASIPDGYWGFNWDQFLVRDATQNPLAGVQNALVTGNYVACNYIAQVATVSDATFNFNGAYLRSSYYDDLSISVQGYLNDTLLYSSTIDVDTTADDPLTLEDERWYEFNYLGINRLEFNAGNNRFAMDNFTFNEPVGNRPIHNPAPGSFLLGGIGVTFVGFLRRIKSLG